MEEYKEQSKKILHHDALKWVIIGIACFTVAVFIFGAGMFVGGLKARFSYSWAENYHKNFAGPKEGFFGDLRKSAPLPGDFIESHGVFGQIFEIQEDSFVIKGMGDIEKVILISDKTIIEKGPATVKKEELKVGDQAVTIGSPNDQGQIEAKLIRIFDEGSKPMPYKGFQVPLF